MGMMEGMGKVRGLREALAIQYREMAEEMGLVRKKGRKPYRWDACGNCEDMEGKIQKDEETWRGQDLQPAYGKIGEL